MNYDVNYFINKFEAIPEDDWGKTKLENHCVLYHCGMSDGKYTNTPESTALVTLIRVTAQLQSNWIAANDNGLHYVWEINDGIGDHTLLGNTPKERILNKLYQIRDGN